MLRKRVWLNTPWHNYTDKKKHQLTNSEINQYKLYEEDNVAFNHGDFVNCECVTKPSVPVLNKQPNYMIVYNGTTIESRYYVLSYQYMDGEPAENFGTYRATFIRDVVVDFKSNIEAGIFKCRRGQLDRTQWSPVLVQPEGISLNKVKKAQLPIKSWDEDAQWLTIFYDLTAESTVRKITFDYSRNLNPDYTLAQMQSSFSSKGWSLSATGGTWQYQRNYTNIRKKIRLDDSGHTGVWAEYNIDISPYGATVTLTDESHNINGNGGSSNICGITNLRNYVAGLNFGTARSLTTANFNYDNSSNYSSLRNQYDKALISMSNGLARSSFTQSNFSSSSQVTSQIDSNLNSMLTGNIKLMGSVNRATVFSSLGIATVSLEGQQFSVAFGSVPATGEMELPGGIALDNMYLGCITIPFGDNVTLIEGDNTYEISSDSIKSMATSGWTHTGSAIKDIQILPYCPNSVLNSLFNNSPSSNNINITNLESYLKVPIKVTATNQVLYYGVICSVASSSYRYNINLSSYFSEDKKMDSITKSIRLCNHNHKQFFEFNPALNNGVTAISFEVTLKPFNTLYRICPVFNTEGLYGGNYSDGRGLIWEGGFSMAQVTDAWTEWALNNSTYKEVFDREVKSLEISQDVARQQETLAYETAYRNAQTNIDATKTKAAIGGVLGILGSIGSFGAGSTGGGLLGLAGAAGAAGSIGAGVASIKAQEEIAERNLQTAKQGQALNDTLRAEALSYKQDMFKLNIKAIEAAPGGIATSTEYSIINYYKAYIEVYDCTTPEKTYIDYILQYNGMKIDQIGSIKQWLIGDNSYIEGSLLFCEGLTPVISNAINAELSAGIYVQEGLFNE